IPPEQRARIAIALGVRKGHVTQKISAAHTLWHDTADAFHDSTNRAGQETVASLTLLDQIPVISRKKLIPAVSGQDDFHVPGSQFRHHVSRNTGGIAERLVEVPGQIFQMVKRVRAES